MNDMKLNGKPATAKKDEDTAVQKNLEDIGGRVKAIKKELRLKQSEMAETLGTFYSYISAVEGAFYLLIPFHHNHNNNSIVQKSWPRRYAKRRKV